VSERRERNAGTHEELRVMTEAMEERNVVSGRLFPARRPEPRYADFEYTAEHQADVEGELGVRRAPMAPQPTVQAPSSRAWGPQQMPRRWITDIQALAPLWWVGVHGGAGESTLAQLVPGSRPAQHAWPLPSEPGPGTRVPVVLVARSHWSGLRMAQNAATEWASSTTPGIELLGLVVMADAPGRLPKPLRDLAKVVGGGVPRIWRLPWVQEWRLATGAADDITRTQPRPVARMVSDLTRLLQPAPTQPR